MQAAQRADIHYSTAKTILFFHKHKQKVYFPTPLLRHPLEDRHALATATYCDRRAFPQLPHWSRVEVVSTVSSADVWRGEESGEEGAGGARRREGAGMGR